MDQLLIIGLGDKGTATVVAAAKDLLANKVRINRGRICCAALVTKEDSDYVAREGVISVKTDDVAAALDTFDANEGGRMQVVFTAALNDIVASECLNAAETVKSYFSGKNLNIEMKGVLVLSDKKSADEKAVLDALTNGDNAAFDNLYFVKNDPAVYPDTESLVCSVSRMIYMAFVSKLSSEFDAREKQSVMAERGKPRCGVLGYSKASYLYEGVAQYCGLRGALDVIDNFWISIDKEISEKHSGRYLPTQEFRKEYIAFFEQRVANKDLPNNFFPTMVECIYNETVTLNDDNSENCDYSHKVDDFVAITERLVEIHSRDIAFADNTMFCEGNADAFVSEMNKVADNIASKLMVNAIPVSEDKIDAKNDASLFGLISNEKGDIAEERVYSNPVAIRYLFYKLSDRLTDIYYALDLKAAMEDLKAAFDSNENKETAAFEYLSAAVKLAYIKQFTEKLERFIRQFEDFFAGIPFVWDHFKAQLGDNLAFEGSDSPANILLCVDPETKAEIYKVRSFPLNGNPPVGPNIVTMVSQLFFWGEDAFNNVNAKLPKNDPVYSFEYHLGTSFKKYYIRNKDITVSCDIYHAGGFVTKGYSELSEKEREEVCDKAFAEIVDSLVSAATPVGMENETSLLWGVSPLLVENCNKLGEFLSFDVKKFESRNFDKAILECFSAVYDVDPANL